MCGAAGVALVGGFVPSPVSAGSVRIWPSAVVTDETIRMADLAELRGFDPSTERSLAQAAVAGAPEPGLSRDVPIELIRSALAASGVNMATVTLAGATRCIVTRPSPAPRGPTGPGGPGARPVTATASGGRRNPPAPAQTLRQAVIDYFDVQLARYRGRADVIFDRTDPSVLDLSGPAYTFRVRRRSGPPLGLIQIDVDVLANGQTVQTVPLVVQVSMIRRAVVARRPINQGAAVRAPDVELTRLTFSRLDKLGLDDVAHAVGQRAKRFIKVGSLLEPGQLESVELVRRGQLVTLTSVSGGIRIVTTAKALRAGRLGDTIPVRSADQKHAAFDAVVVGPGAVRIEPPSPTVLAASHLTEDRS